jgi:hypothetical protein
MLGSAIAVAAIAGLTIVLYVRANALPTVPPGAVRVIVSRQIYGSSLPSTVVFEQEEFSRPATQIYAQMTAVRLPPNAVQSCPAIITKTPYYHYEFVFTSSNQPYAIAISDGVGCMDILVTYANGVHATYFWYDNGTSFWDVLHDLTGAPRPTEAR